MPKSALGSSSRSFGAVVADAEHWCSATQPLLQQLEAMNVAMQTREQGWRQVMKKVGAGIRRLILLSSVQARTTLERRVADVEAGQCRRFIVADDDDVMRISVGDGRGGGGGERATRYQGAR